MRALEGGRQGPRANTWRRPGGANVTRRPRAKARCDQPARWPATGSRSASVKAYGPAPPSVGTESAARIRVVRCVRLKGAARGQEPIPGAAPEGRTSQEGSEPMLGASRRKARPGESGPGNRMRRQSRPSRPRRQRHPEGAARGPEPTPGAAPIGSAQSMGPVNGAQRAPPTSIVSHYRAGRQDWPTGPGRARGGADPIRSRSEWTRRPGPARPDD